jgi:hypothetical protein
VTVRPDADIGDVLSKMAGQYRGIQATKVVFTTVQRHAPNPPELPFL